MEWISVKERLPQSGHRYLVVCEIGMCTADYDYYGDWIGDNCAVESESSPSYESVTHWCELPEPPKQ